jgi:hypothetical protein
MAKTICLVVGIVFLIVGVLGFVMPGLLGAHLSLAHNLVHIISGALALYFGTAGSLSAARTFCIVFGFVYLLLGVAGFVAGQNDIPTVVGMEDMGPDARMFKVIPGQLELGTMDHVIHIVIGLLFLIGGFTTRVTAPVTR